MLETVGQVAPHCPELREIICFDDWDAFVAARRRRRASRCPRSSPTDPVMIQYTSGTTGFPKGALLHHRGLVNNGADTADRMGVARRRRRRSRRCRCSTPAAASAACSARCRGARRWCWSRRSTRPGARAVRDLSRQRDGRRAHDAGRDAGAPGLRRHRPVARCKAICSGGSTVPARAGAAARAAARRAVHHRVRPDRMLAGGVA